MSLWLWWLSSCSVTVVTAQEIVVVDVVDDVDVDSTNATITTTTNTTTTDSPTSTPVAATSTWSPSSLTDGANSSTFSPSSPTDATLTNSSGISDDDEDDAEIPSLINVEDYTNACVATDDSQTLRNTFRVYGGIFLIIVVLFLILRARYPQTYSIRSWGNYPTKLASSTSGSGFIEFITNLVKLSDEQLQDECGMDSTCLIRVNYFGLKICGFCMLVAVVLMPVYGTANSSKYTDCITDTIQSISISHVPQNSKLLLVSTISCYFIFGFIMYSILVELEWLRTVRS